MDTTRFQLRGNGAIEKERGAIACSHFQDAYRVR
jgi:hypothetical protein